MSESLDTRATHGPLPLANAKAKGRRFPFVWIVPVVAAIIAGYVGYDRAREIGPMITVRFKDVSGLTVGQTEIKYRGVPVGRVTGITLSEDQNYAEVKARLRRSAAPIARDGSLFWIVRPEVGIGNVTGLQTVLSGPEIRLAPGNGEPRSDFAGLEDAPPGLERKGLSIRLQAGRPGFLRPNSPIYYRGVEVGVVRDIQLNANATAVDIQVFIERRYANLVRSDSVFWHVHGATVNAGLFSGLNIKIESLKSLAVGGVAFATPNNARDSRAKDGAVFRLYAEARQEWLAWAPPISIPSAE